MNNNEYERVTKSRHDLLILLSAIDELRDMYQDASERSLLPLTENAYQKLDERIKATIEACLSPEDDVEIYPEPEDLDAEYEASKMMVKSAVQEAMLDLIKPPSEDGNDPMNEIRKEYRKELKNLIKPVKKSKTKSINSTAESTKPVIKRPPAKSSNNAKEDVKSNDNENTEKKSLIPNWLKDLFKKYNL